MTKTVGIVSAPTPKTIAFVADYQRRKAEATRRQVLAREERMLAWEREQMELRRQKLAKEWQRPNRPFGHQLVGFADSLKRQQAEATDVAMNGRQRDGRFVSRSLRRESQRVAEKLSALGFGSK